jgi:hypothetical protein
MKCGIFGKELCMTHNERLVKRAFPLYKDLNIICHFPNCNRAILSNSRNNFYSRRYCSIHSRRLHKPVTRRTRTVKQMTENVNRYIKSNEKVLKGNKKFYLSLHSHQTSKTHLTNYGPKSLYCWKRLRIMTKGSLVPHYSWSTSWSIIKKTT